jgi:hypothetical protein
MLLAMCINIRGSINKILRTPHLLAVKRAERVARGKFYNTSKNQLNAALSPRHDGL